MRTPSHGRRGRRGMLRRRRAASCATPALPRAGVGDTHRSIWGTLRLPGRRGYPPGMSDDPAATPAYDGVIVGGGIVGLATALALSETPRRRLLVLEAEEGVGRHQTGHNSGVIHAGLYYRPGSLKARLCAAGRAELEAFCQAEAIPFERCGKLVLATEAGQLPALDELERRAAANGLVGVARLGPEAIREREPQARGVAALLVPQTGIVDYRQVAAAYARRLAERGVTLWTGAGLLRCERRGRQLLLETRRGAAAAGLLVNCAGLQADRVARLCGVDPGVAIVPFRGEYQSLVPGRRQLVRHLVYPVPDPRLPFLGVHFTRRIDGEVEVGPNAIPGLARHGYRRRDIDLRDLAGIAAWPGTWRLFARYWRSGLAELWRAFMPRAGLADLRRMIPAVDAADLRPAGAGVRAQAVGRDGRLLDDFHIVEAPGMVHVLNAPSPAATASLAIGRHVAARAESLLGG